MDLTKYEKIDGREALRRLANGEKIIRETGSPYFISDEGRFVCDNAAIYRPHVIDLTLDEILNECEWYIPKPFDVRQAMRDRPNEWVGKFPTGSGVWYKVGFDNYTMQAVEATIYSELAPIYAPKSGVTSLRVNALDACIPIEDVPVNVAK